MVKAAKPRKRPHACPRCTAKFVCPSNLATHVRTVHEKRRDHACPQCGATFGHASHLTRHMRTQHPDTTQDDECPL
jgi:uncharacterized Zn-finger protein